MDKLREADTVVSCLGQAMLDGESGLKNVPGLLLRVINEDLWQRRIIAQTGKPVGFETFLEFVITEPLEGLGADIGTLKDLCRSNTAALSAIDRVMQRNDGPPTKDERATFNNVQGYVAPTGNSAARALRKLRADAPEAHARVLAGELSPHAAMVEAGFRRKTLQIPTDVDGAARALARKFTPEELQRLMELLAERIAVDV